MLKNTVKLKGISIVGYPLLSEIAGIIYKIAKN